MCYWWMFNINMEIGVEIDRVDESIILIHDEFVRTQTIA